MQIVLFAECEIIQASSDVEAGGLRSSDSCLRFPRKSHLSCKRVSINQDNIQFTYVLINSNEVGDCGNNDRKADDAAHDWSGKLEVAVHVFSLQMSSEQRNTLIGMIITISAHASMAGSTCANHEHGIGRWLDV